MWSNYQTSIIVAVTLTILISLFWFLQSLALVVFVALLLAVLLTPAVDYLTARKIPRLWSSLIILVLFISFVTWLFITLSGTFIPAFTRFINDIPNMAESLKNLPFVQPNSLVGEQLDEMMKGITAFSLTALKSSLGIIVSIFSKILNLVIILFITFYLLKDGKIIKSYLANLFPSRDKGRISTLFNNIIQALSAYIRGQLTICLITGVFVFAYFTIRDLPYAPVFAVLSAIGEFIPVVGPTLASLCGTVFAFTDTPITGSQTLIFYMLLTQINHNMIYPYLIGKSLNLHPVAIMIGILLGGETLGPIGMFLAVPCMVIIKLVIEDIARHRAKIVK